MVLALVSWDSPRVLLVSRSPRQRWRDSAAYYPAYRLRAKLFKGLLRALVVLYPQAFIESEENAHLPGKRARMALARQLGRCWKGFSSSASARSVFPEYFSTGTTPRSIEHCVQKYRGRDLLIERIATIFPQMDRCVVCVGTTDHQKRKFIIQVRQHNGTVVGYIKYGETEEARASILQERDCLSALPAGIGPSCLSFDEEPDCAWIALSPVTGRNVRPYLPRQPTHPFFCDLSDFTQSMNSVNMQVADFESHPAIQKVIRAYHATVLSKESSSSGMPECGWLLDQVFGPLKGHSWPIVVQHGDFAPWNLIQASAASDAFSKLKAIDWEEGTFEGFPCLDLLFYILQTGYLMHHWNASKAIVYAGAMLRNIWPRWFHFQCNEEQVRSMIRLAALQAWLSSEDLISGTELQLFRLKIWRGV